MADTQTLTVDDVIVKYALEADRIYRNRTAGDSTWTGLLATCLLAATPLLPAPEKSSQAGDQSRTVHALLKKYAADCDSIYNKAPGIEYVYGTYLWADLLREFLDAAAPLLHNTQENSRA